MVRHEQGRTVLRQGKSNGVLLKARRLILKSTAPSGIGLKPLNSKSGRSRHYSGLLEFQVQDGELAVKNTIPARDYVAVVISSETSENWPIEALKAQAVLTQTRLARYRPGDTLGDSTQREAYLGAGYLKPGAHRAVSAVWGQTLTYQGRPVTPYYHASCAGHTSDGKFFGGNASTPWLSAVACPYCAKGPFTKPTVSTISKEAFQKAFPGDFPVFTRLDSRHRPLRIRQADISMSGYQLWMRLGQRLGWDKAPGTRFQLARLADGNIQVKSTGAGHGVGLCQWGAAGMARQGKSYREILKFYFPKVALLE